MTISLIVAMTPDRVIGKDGRLPWRMPADLRHFRRLTMGHVVIMGRRTHDSIGSALEGRINIVLTSRKESVAVGCLAARSPDEAMRIARSAAGAGPDRATADPDAPPDEIMVIGGASVYAAFLPAAEKLYVTFVHTKLSGDTFFPDIDFREWREIEREEHPSDENNPYAHTFAVYARKPR
jgi:dihydrofolate reductase